HATRTRRPERLALQVARTPLSKPSITNVIFQAFSVQASSHNVRRTTIWLGSLIRRGACTLQDFEWPREYRQAPRKESDGQSAVLVLETTPDKSHSEGLAR